MTKVIPITLDAQAQRPASGRALMLTCWPVLGRALRSGHLMTSLRVLSLMLLVAAVASGLLTEDAQVGLSVLLMWGVFWPLFTSLVTPTLGNAFCAICPHGFVGKWLNRIGLRRSYPKRLRGVGVSLLILVLAYWVISYAMPGSLGSSTRNTAWYFLAFSVAAFGTFYVFKDMAWCKYVCPLGPLLATHGRAGVLQITTDKRDCDDCRGFECAKACSYHLSPFRFEQRNNMEACTLCTDCVTACDSVDLVVRPPAHALRREIVGQHRNEMWVYIVVLAVVGVGIQFLHGLQHTPLKTHLPWNVAGTWLNDVLALDAKVFNFSGLLALCTALALTVPVCVWAYRRAAQVAGTSWQEAANQLSCALAPLAVLGLIPHAVVMFATRNGHALLNETGAWLGQSWQFTPFAARGDAWLGWINALPYLAIGWTLWLLWKRATLLADTTQLRWRLWLYASVPVWLYSAIFVVKIGATVLMAAQEHVH